MCFLSRLIYVSYLLLCVSYDECLLCLVVSVFCVLFCVSFVSCHVDRQKPPTPRGGFLFTMFPDQEPCVRDFTTKCDGRISS